MRRDLQKGPAESHPKHCLMPGVWPPAATLQASGTSLPHPTYQAMRWSNAISGARWADESH